MDSDPIEEQTLLRYREKVYCPVKIGQVFNGRYTVLAKLGYGCYSTVWLARDETTTRYTAIKVFILDDDSRQTSAVRNEVSMLQHLASCSSEHGGASIARLADDIFKYDGHYCIVMKPLGCSLLHLQRMFPQNQVPRPIIIATVMRLLACVNWLQLHCGVVHAEITTQNVLMRITDESMFERAEMDEFQSQMENMMRPPPPVYPSRGHPKDIMEAIGGATLTDFGSARLGENLGWSMVDTYRAPEVLMGNLWDYQVDIWSIGVLVLELLEGRNVFDPIDRQTHEYVLPQAMAQYIGYMGLPPRWMVQLAKPNIRSLFNDEGEWIAQPPIRETPFEDFVTVIPPGEEKDRFLKFIRKIFTWDPSERAMSSDLFEDEWLTAPYRQNGIL